MYECGYEENTVAMLQDFWIWATQRDEAIQLAVVLGHAQLGAGLRARVLEAAPVLSVKV